VIPDLKQAYFERTYKGKAFSDLGVIERYDHRNSFFGGTPYVQVKNPEGTAWCVVADTKFKNLQRQFPVGSSVRMTGKLEEWYTYDSTLLLEDDCAVGPGASVSGAAAMSIISDLQVGYFERTYKGRAFSDVGKIDRYDRRFALFGQGKGYVQVAKEAKYDFDKVFCEIDESRFASMPTSTPVGTKVRIAGKMEGWEISDQTLLLEENCAVTRQ
jgi:hypothetical protein